MLKFSTTNIFKERQRNVKLSNRKFWIKTPCALPMWCQARSRRQHTGARGSGAFIQVEFNLWWQQLYFEMNSPAQRGEWALLHHQTIEGSPTRTKLWKLGSFHELGDKFAYIRRAQYSMNSSAFNSLLCTQKCVIDKEVSSNVLMTENKEWDIRQIYFVWVFLFALAPLLIYLLSE